MRTPFSQRRFLTNISSPALAPTAPAIDTSFDEAIAAEDERIADSTVVQLPEPCGHININFCKSPNCVNFGIADEFALMRLSPKNQLRYKVTGNSQYPHLTCRACMVSFPVKSNVGVYEEYARMRDETSVREASCPNEACAQHNLGVSAGKPFYSSFGKTAIGSPRYKCMACKKTFSYALQATHRQREPHKNKLIFKLLMNKVAIRRICEISEISPTTLYGKIDFLYRQCLKFMAERESKLPTMAIKRLYLGVDRQNYSVNWTQRDDRRNTILSSVSSVDNETGYCFGFHLNFDPLLNTADTEADAAACGDFGTPPPFRKHAREWLEQDYVAAMIKAKNPIAIESLAHKVAVSYAKAAARGDAEAGERPTDEEKLPDRGMQIHSEYTLYGHFMHIKALTAGVEKIRFFLDQDSGMRAACLAAFAEDIKIDRRVDAFFVSIAKDLTVDQRRQRKAEAKDALAEFMVANPQLSQQDAILQMIKDKLATMKPIGRWKDKWLDHPFPDMGEPEKKIAYLTDLGDYDPDHLAWLYNKASLHSCDNVFMQIRRRLMLLERGIHSAGNAGRVWSGYAPYNPTQIGKILTIFRVFHNYMHVGKDKQTPAMRLGLAKGPVKYEDVLYFTS